MTLWLKKKSFLTGKIFSFFMLMMLSNSFSHAGNGFVRASNLPDISGISWISEDLFLVVHDAKSQEKGPRVSLLKLPHGEEGVLWKPLQVRFSNFESNDFESVARIPASNDFLLVESTEELKEKPYSCRIFFASLRGESLEIVNETKWPSSTTNIEGASVSNLDGKLFFIFAERAHGEQFSEIKVSEFQTKPFQFGVPKVYGTFKSPYPVGKNARQVSAIEIDSAGCIYVASCEDPDDDNGPFSSALYQIGKIVSQNSEPKIIFEKKPLQLAIIDGFKVEGVAVREFPGKSPEIFVGVDDENYGGTVRPIRINRH